MDNFKKVLPLVKQYRWVILGIVIFITVVLLSQRNGFFKQISPFTQEELKENKSKSLWNRITNLNNTGVYVDEVSPEQLELIKLALKEMSRYEDRYIELKKNVSNLNIEVTKIPEPHDIMLDNKTKVQELGTSISEVKSTLGYTGVGETNVANRLTILETATTPAPDYRIEDNIDSIKLNTSGLAELRGIVTDTSTTANRLDNHFFPKINNTILQKYAKYFSDKFEELFSGHYETLDNNNKREFNECMKNLVDPFSQDDLDFFKEYSEKYGDALSVMGPGNIRSDHAMDIGWAWKAYVLRCDIKTDRTNKLPSGCNGLLADSNPILYKEDDSNNNNNNKNPIDILKETTPLERYGFPGLEETINIVWSTGWLTTSRVAYDKYIELHGQGTEFEVLDKGIGYLITLGGITELTGLWRGYDLEGMETMYEIECVIRLSEKSEDLQKMIKTYIKYMPILEDSLKKCINVIKPAMG